MRLRVIGYYQGKYLHTFSNQALLMKYKDYTIAQQKDIEKKNIKYGEKKVDHI